MNLYVKQAIKHYQDNLNRFNRIAADCVDMLTSDKSTDRLKWYLRGHYIYIDCYHCPLCNHYICVDCPIGILGHPHCHDTPWYDLEHLRSYFKDIKSHRSAVLYVSKLRKAFEAELKFLKEVGK